MRGAPCSQGLGLPAHSSAQHQHGQLGGCELRPEGSAGISQAKKERDSQGRGRGTCKGPGARKSRMCLGKPLGMARVRSGPGVWAAGPLGQVEQANKGAPP